MNRMHSMRAAVVVLVCTAAPAWAGELSLAHEGNKHRVTCADIFELVFYEENGGCVREWYDILNDPGRGTDIITGTIDGSPQVLFHIRARRDEKLWTNSQDDISDREGEHAFETLEESPVRLVLRAVSHMHTFPEFAAEHDIDSIVTQTYTIYTDGTVFIHQTAHRREGSSTVEGVGSDQYRPMQFGIGYEQEQWSFGTDLEDPAVTPEPLRVFTDGDATVWAVYSDDPALEADLVTAIYVPWDAMDVLRRHSGICWRRNGWQWAPGDTESFDLMLLFDHDIADVADRLWVARDYQNPAVPTMLTGTLEGGGFDEHKGCYTLGASDSTVTFQLDGSEQRRFHPAFEVHDFLAGSAEVLIDDEPAAPGDEYLDVLLSDHRLLVHFLVTIDHDAKIEIRPFEAEADDDAAESPDIFEGIDDADAPPDASDVTVFPDTAVDPAVDGEDDPAGIAAGGCSCTI